MIHAHKVIEPARAIKSVEEILCMNYAIAVAEDGMWRMREALRPGMTEIELWALLWQANIEAGGDWIEGRLLAAGIAQTLGRRRHPAGLSAPENFWRLTPIWWGRSDTWRMCHEPISVAQDGLRITSANCISEPMRKYNITSN